VLWRRYELYGWVAELLNKELPLEFYGAADHWEHRADDEDYYTQAVDLFQLMSKEHEQGTTAGAFLKYSTFCG